MGDIMTLDSYFPRYIFNQGIAIAGVQNNVRESKNTANTWNNLAKDNNATSYNGNVVSGV